MAFWHHPGHRVMLVDQRCTVGQVEDPTTPEILEGYKQFDSQTEIDHGEAVFVYWGDGAKRWELINDLMPADPKPEEPVNHPINPTAHMLTDLWLDSMAGVPGTREKYFACLTAARWGAAVRHLAAVALLVVVSEIVKPLTASWKARNHHA